VGDGLCRYHASFDKLQLSQDAALAEISGPQFPPLFANRISARYLRRIAIDWEQKKAACAAFFVDS